MQAIVTKYHGPTNRRGSRMTAKAWGGQISVAVDNRFSMDKNAVLAASALAAKFGWTGDVFCMGGLPDGQSRVFVNIGPNIGGQPFGLEGEDWFRLPPSVEKGGA